MQYDFWNLVKMWTTLMAPEVKENEVIAIDCKELFTRSLKYINGECDKKQAFLFHF
jgi:hypothetical protein